MVITGGEFGFIDRVRQRIGTGGKGVALGIGDDAAILCPPPGKLLAACDMLVEGVHFRKEYIRPWQLGWKALAVNISDIAAMGGVPLFALVSIGLADWVDDTYIEGIYEGMLDIADRFGVDLVGGDTVSSPKAMVINMTILGSTDSPVTRSGAKPGHLVAVTGYLGRSAAGLAYLQKMSNEQGIPWKHSRDAQSEGTPSLQSGAQPRVRAGVQPGARPRVQPRLQAGVQPETQPGFQRGAHLELQPGVQQESQEKPTGGHRETRLEEERWIQDTQAKPSQTVAERGTAPEDWESDATWLDELIKAHLEPMPRVCEGRALASTGVVSAMMDISDGLAGEAHHIARESKVGVALREDAVPIGYSTLLAARCLESDPLKWALSGGEDFELVFTFPPESTDRVRDALSNAGGSMYIVGHITPETEGVVLVGSDGAKRSLPYEGYNHFRRI